MPPDTIAVPRAMLEAIRAFIADAPRLDYQEDRVLSWSSFMAARLDAMLRGQPVEPPPNPTANAPSFAEYPEMLAERRAREAEDASAWAPRDALLSLLRQIDRGLPVDAVVIAYRVSDKEGGGLALYLTAGPNVHVALGVLAVANQRIARIAAERD